jgi:sulfonate transport system permease protein
MTITPTITPFEYRRRFRAAVPLLWLPGFADLASGVLRRAGPALIALALPLAIFAAWSLAARYQLVAPQILPAPSVVGTTAIELIKSGQLQSELAVSLFRLAAGLAIGAVAGLAVGLAMGLSTTVEAYLAPTVRAIWLVPSLGWLPFFMLIFGIGEALKIVLIAKACFLPMMVNSFDGARGISPKHRDVVRMLELGRFDTLRFLVIPSLLPHLLTGLRLSLSKGWQVLVLVEMIASAAGIGYLMTWGRKSFQLDIVLVTMLLIGVVGWLLDRGALLVQTRATAWASRSIG